MWTRWNTARKGINNENYTNKERAVSKFRMFLSCFGREKKPNIRGTVIVRICCMGEIEWRMAMRSVFIILVTELEWKWPWGLETWITNGGRGRSSKHTILFCIFVIKRTFGKSKYWYEKMDLKPLKPSTTPWLYSPCRTLASFTTIFKAKCFIIYTGWRRADWHISNLNIAPTR